jgi:hypothetical protein
MEAYLHGLSTQQVDDVVKALGIDSGVSKSEVSRICADLDIEVAAFWDRSLAGLLPVRVPRRHLPGLPQPYPGSLDDHRRSASRPDQG